LANALDEKEIKYEGEICEKGDLKRKWWRQVLRNQDCCKLQEFMASWQTDGKQTRHEQHASISEIYTSASLSLLLMASLSSKKSLHVIS